MAQGCQVFDASQNLRFNSGDYLPRFLGTVETGTANGSLYVADFANGIPFVYYTGYEVQKQPRVYVSGHTIYWEFSSVGTGACNGYIVYGVR